MTRPHALSALAGVALLLALSGAPNATRANDVTGDPIAPAQPLGVGTYCNGPCNSTTPHHCASPNTACCCRASVTSPWVCQCKDPTDCTPENNCR